MKNIIYDLLQSLAYTAIAALCYIFYINNPSKDSVIIILGIFLITVGIREYSSYKQQVVIAILYDELYYATTQHNYIRDSVIQVLDTSKNNLVVVAPLKLLVNITDNLEEPPKELLSSNYAYQHPDRNSNDTTNPNKGQEEA